jgi:hypothetical protein
MQGGMMSVLLKITINKDAFDLLRHIGAVFFSNNFLTFVGNFLFWNYIDR